MKEWFYASIRQPHGSAGSPLIRATQGKPLFMRITEGTVVILVKDVYHTVADKLYKCPLINL